MKFAIYAFGTLLYSVVLVLQGHASKLSGPALRERASLVTKEDIVQANYHKRRWARDQSDEDILTQQQGPSGTVSNSLPVPAPETSLPDPDGPTSIPPSSDPDPQGPNNSPPSDTEDTTSRTPKQVPVPDDPDLETFTTYIKNNPPDPKLLQQETITLFVLPNNAMEDAIKCSGPEKRPGRECDSSESSLQPRKLVREEKLNFRYGKRTTPGQNALSNSFVATAKVPFMGDLPPTGALIQTGGFGDEHTKVMERNPRLDHILRRSASEFWEGKIYSGGGSVSYILDMEVIKNDVIITINQTFVSAGTFEESILADTRLEYLEKLFRAHPSILKKLNSAEKVTFLAPSQEGFEAEGYKINEMNADDLQSFVNNHTVDSKIIAYTPNLISTVGFQTKGGINCTITVKNNEWFVNTAKIVGKNHIIQNGVIHIVDEVIIPQNSNSKTIPIQEYDLPTENPSIPEPRTEEELEDTTSSASVVGLIVGQAFLMTLWMMIAIGI